MYFRMTILALPADRLDGQGPAGRAVTERVAFRADSWPRNLEHELVHRAVRIVAIRAILAHRRVLEEERSALFGVALVASVVNGICLQQTLGGAAMRVMTVGTDHLSFAQGHV